MLSLGPAKRKGIRDRQKNLRFSRFVNLVRSSIDAFLILKRKGLEIKPFSVVR